MTDNTDHKAVNQWMLANGWEWKGHDDHSKGGLWMKGKFDVHQDLAAEMYCMADRRVEEAEKQGRSDGWDANKQNAIYMFRNLAAKIDYYQSSGASDEDTIKGVHQWLDDQDRVMHFNELPRVYSQQELEAAVEQARGQAFDEARQNLYTASQVRFALNNVLRSKTDPGLIGVIMEDLADELIKLRATHHPKGGSNAERN